MTATTVYAILNKRIKGLASGVKNVEVDGTTLIFHLMDGSIIRMTFPDPIGFKTAEIRLVEDKPHLICIFTDDTEIDAGELPSSAPEVWIGKTEPPSKNYTLWVDTSIDDDTGGSVGAILHEELVSQVEIGSVKVGTKYAGGVSLEKVIRDMLTMEEAPVLAVAHDPTPVLYDVVEETLAAIKTIATVTKKSYPVAKIDFYINGSLVRTLSGESVAEGGKFESNYTFTKPTNEDVKIKVDVFDTKGLKATKTITILFIGKSYFGTVEGEEFEVTEDLIKGLQFNTLKNSRNLTYENIQVEYGKILYAYPKSLGKVTKVVDDNGFDTTTSYEVKEIKVDDIDYYYVILIDAMGTDGAYQKFT